MTNQTRRDNVEFHQGAAARRAGQTLTENPFPLSSDPDSRRARWNLGWHEEPAAAVAVAVEQLDNVRQDETHPLPLDVDDEGTNANRAEWALQALEAFQAATGTDDCDAIGDLVADLLHLCDREGARFGWSARDQIERGIRAYQQEITDEEPELVDAADVVGAFAA